MITVQVQHLDELLQSLHKVEIKNALNTALKKSIFTIERTAKINTPVRTGLLRNSYETDFFDLEATLRNFRNYAPYVEARRGFIENTYEMELDNVQTIFDNELDTLFLSL